MSRNSPSKFSAPHSLCGNRFEGGSEFRLRVDQSPQNCLPTAAVVCAWRRRQISERAHLYSPRGGAIPFAPPPTPPTRRRQAGSLTHSQYSNLNTPSCLSASLSQVGWQAGTCVGLWISLSPSCLPSFLASSSSLPSQSPFAIAGFFTSEPN